MQVEEVALTERRGWSDASGEHVVRSDVSEERRGGVTGQGADAPGRNYPEVAPVRGGGLAPSAPSGRRLLAMGISVATKVQGCLAHKKMATP